LGDKKAGLSYPLTALPQNPYPIFNINVWTGKK